MIVVNNGEYAAELEELSRKLKGEERNAVVDGRISRAENNDECIIQMLDTDDDEDDSDDETSVSGASGEHDNGSGSENEDNALEKPVIDPGKVFVPPPPPPRVFIPPKGHLVVTMNPIILKKKETKGVDESPPKDGMKDSAKTKVVPLTATPARGKIVLPPLKVTPAIIEESQGSSEEESDEGSTDGSSDGSASEVDIDSSSSTSGEESEGEPAKIEIDHGKVFVPPPPPPKVFVPPKGHLVVTMNKIIL